LMLSDLDHRRIRASKGQLDQRWRTLGNLLNSALGRRTRAISVDAEYQAGGVWVGLCGADCERIDRNRGVANVAPLVTLADNLTAWLSYQEVWAWAGGRLPFSFRQTSLTIYIGEVGDPLKPQLLRLEWPGLHDWDNSGVGFQSPGAGHPHWQVDVFDTLRTSRDRPTFNPQLSNDVENFDDVLDTPPLFERITSLSYERMHLASVAPWWLTSSPEFGVHHIHAPVDPTAISRWIDSAIAYILQELARCVPRY